MLRAHRRRTTELSWGESGVTEAFLEKVTQSRSSHAPGIEHEKPFFHLLSPAEEPYLQQMSHQYLPLATITFNFPLITIIFPPNCNLLSSYPSPYLLPPSGISRVEAPKSDPKQRNPGELQKVDRCLRLWPVSGDWEDFGVAASFTMPPPPKSQHEGRVLRGLEDALPTHQAGPGQGGQAGRKEP